MKVHRLTPTHVAEYRAFMLQAYANEPEAFTATVAEREPLPLEWWLTRVSDQPDATELVFGAFVESRLVGVTGLRYKLRPRTRHKATLFGMCVLRDFTGRGIGRSLVAAVFEQALLMPELRVVQLTVTQSNIPALRLYESCGFVPFGIEPFANKISEGFVSKVHMWRSVDPDVP